MPSATSIITMSTALLSASVSSFAPMAPIPTPRSSPISKTLFASTMLGPDSDMPQQAIPESPMQSAALQVETEKEVNAPKPITKKSPPKKRGPAAHKNGLFSPLVTTAKAILGDEKLNKVRAKAIGVHSDVIGKFVATSSSTSGDAALEALFAISDKNKDGRIDEDELLEALNKLGFQWIGKKQANKILARAAGDEEKGYITKEQFKQEAPKTLKTNLTKLAKKNGGDLGFLV